MSIDIFVPCYRRCTKNQPSSSRGRIPSLRKVPSFPVVGMTSFSAVSRAARDTGGGLRVRPALVSFGGLDHLHAHDVNLALVGIHVRAHFDMMALMSFQRLRIGNVP